MKKRFLLFFLPCFCQTGIAVAGFTNDTNDISADYRTNGEYMKNGQALTAIGADKAYTGTGGGAYTGLSGMGVTVLLFNETVYASHEDLSNQIKNTSFNTTADDVWGSQMAGIIAAEKNGLGLHGIKIHPDMQGCEIDCEGFMKAYEICDKMTLRVEDEDVIVCNMSPNFCGTSINPEYGCGWMPVMIDAGAYKLGEDGLYHNLPTDEIPFTMSPEDYETIMKIYTKTYQRMKDSGEIDI